LFHGYVALVEGVVKRLRTELSVDAPVVATGGLATVFQAELSFLTAVDPHLTLLGLRLVWERNHR
jgi:type III pantothenate kinase